MRDTFVLYSNYYDILKDTSDEDLGSLFRAILSYAKRDEVIELPFHLTLAFGFIKNQMDIDFEKYSEKIKKLKNNGRKGGLTKGKTNSETAIQVVTDNTSDLTNNQYGNELPADCNLSSEVNENKSEIRQNKSDEVTDEEREIIKNYVKKNRLASKSVEGYVSKIIDNGDYRRILNKELPKTRPKISREERIKAELAEIHDKRSCAKVLYRYHLNGEGPPDEFWDLMKKYNLEKYDNLYDYIISLSKESEDKKRLAG